MELNLNCQLNYIGENKNKKKCLGFNILHVEFVEVSKNLTTTNNFRQQRVIFFQFR